MAGETAAVVDVKCRQNVMATGFGLTPTATCWATAPGRMRASLFDRDRLL